MLSAAIVWALGPFGCPEEREPNEAREIDEPAVPAAPDATESGNGPTAQAPDPADPTPQPPQQTGPQQLNADVAQSKVGFAVARATTGHIGRFSKFSATLELADGRPRKLEIAVKTGSVVADREGLTSHLASADFFDADRFPTATFSTESITPVVGEGEEPNSYAVAGTMRLHGVSGKLEFPATIVVEPNRVVGRATLEISAKAFGIDYAGMEAELAEDTVALEIDLVFPR
jgi:polyisoprenoid-binding protein YceI